MKVFESKNTTKLGIYYFVSVFLLLLVLVAVVSLVLPYTPKKYASEKYGFSFVYPANYSVIDNDTTFEDTIFVSPIASDGNLLSESVWILIYKENENVSIGDVVFDSPDHKHKISVSTFPSKRNIPEVRRVFQKIVGSFTFLTL